ncbi:DUF3027 domain-containing protein [Rathayibacter sp. AY1A7]|nr:DUF3027 domain-containing protein [Rathayibacter sp. AY1A7]
MAPADDSAPAEDATSAEDSGPVADDRSEADDDASPGEADEATGDEAPEPVYEADTVLAGSLDVARAALAEIAPEGTIGELVTTLAQGEHVVSLQFANLMRGYPGWLWTATLSRIDETEDVNVLEVELLPGEGAVLAPDWVPWSVRLADYQTAQDALGEEVENADDDELEDAEEDDLDDESDDDSDEDEGDSDDDDDPVDDDDDSDDDSDGDDSDDEDSDDSDDDDPDDDSDDEDSDDVEPEPAPAPAPTTRRRRRRR